MKVRVKFFAILRERAGTAEVIQELAEGAQWPICGAVCRKNFPSSMCPGFGMLYAVNQNYVGSTITLHDRDEVVFIPPVSGG